jgi:O-antigen ligase
LVYEKFAITLFVIGVLSLAVARYPARGASQLLFLLNTFLVYAVVVWVVKSRTQFIRLLTYGAVSTGIIIALGYVQFVATLFSTTYYFWQYWAIRVASLYYGLPLAKVLQYSNSWVTVQGEEKTLRMFSVMTSSHAFAMVCVLFLAFALPLLFARVKKFGPVVEAGRSFVRVVWVTVVFACLALIISGTRGVWAGMIPALLLVVFLYYWTRLKHYVVPVFAALLLVVILFEASPLLDRAFMWVRKSGGEGTLDRVASIIDPAENSNAGRLEMWKAASVYALEHPLGVGYGNFVVTLSKNQDVSFEEAASQENNLYNLPQRYITAHSLYLQLLVELSVVGLVLFGLMWLGFFHRAWKYVVSRQVTAETVFITTIFIVWIWFLAYGVFDVTWLNDKILLYTFVLMGVARYVFNDFEHERS